MANLEITQLPVLEDNYIYVLRDAVTNKTAVVDPAISQPVLDHLAQTNGTLDFILITHHHGDHVGGVVELVEKTGAIVVGARGDASRIPCLQVQLAEGDLFLVGSIPFRVLEIDGHTMGHIAYYSECEKVLFSGDTLFRMGCGRLFEGTAEIMWGSLLKIMSLPGTTRVYCTHEYSASNAKFAMAVAPHCEEIQNAAREIFSRRQAGFYTVPFLLAEDMKANPFLLCRDSFFRSGVGLNDLDPIEAFKVLRQKKNHFTGLPVR